MKHHSAGGIVAAEIDGGTKFLVIHQRRKNGELQWVMPKGHLEPGEASLDAAIREIQEEVGLSDLNFVGSAGSQTFGFKDDQGCAHEKTVDWYVFCTDDPHALELNAGEGFIEAKWEDYLDACRRLTHSEFVDFLSRAEELIRTRHT
jgi:8-oxo-dGTP pyrophosphatase MutT (NUDIX family)